MTRSSKKITPPKWAIRFINWFCPEYLAEAIIGDLLEQFNDHVESKGVTRAKLKFIWTALRFFHPAILLRNKNVKILNNMGLYKSHLIVALRSMKKYKFYAVVNILGLALAMTFVFLSYLFIQRELNYDDFHANGDHIYRLHRYEQHIETKEILDGDHDAITSIPLMPSLASDLPLIKRYSRFVSNSATVDHNGVPVDETICLADPDFLSMFSFPILRGDNGALNDPNAILLSVDMAEKYFPHDDPMNKDMRITLNDSSKTFVVKGVINNKEQLSSIQFDMLIPFERIEMLVPKEMMESFNVSFIESYLELDQPAPSDLHKTLSAAVNDKVESRLDGFEYVINVQPLSDIHLNADLTGNAEYTDPQKLFILSALALLVFVIALVNFTVLSTGHSLHRVKEIGLRKTFGANAASLRTQLIFESLVIAFFASILTIGSTIYAVPWFNELIEGSIDRNMLLYNSFFMVLIIVIISLLTGGIQSIVLMRLKPMIALRGKFKLTGKTSWANQAVIVFQFSASILLITGTIIVHSQLNFIQKKELGFEEGRLIEIRLPDSRDVDKVKRSIERMKRVFNESTQIQSVAGVTNGFENDWSEVGFDQPNETTDYYSYNNVDDDYLKTMDIELILGNDFSKNEEVAKSEIIVNESLVKQKGWKEPLNQQIPGDFEQPHRIIGVIKDFHYGSLHDKIQPLILATNFQTLRSGINSMSTYVNPATYNSLMVRIGPGNLTDAIDFLEQSWEKVNPNHDFHFNFVDESLASNYQEEQQWKKIIDASAGYALFIAWMGLLGLSRLSVQGRMKEIGIRKVLGSSVASIVIQLCKGYVVLILIALFVAAPLGWMAAKDWLQSFVYRIELSPEIFVLSGVAVLIVTALSIGIQTARAAFTNPTEVLRSE